MSTQVPLVLFLGYDCTHGLTYHLADWLSANVAASGPDMKILGLSTPAQQEPGLFDQLRARGIEDLRVVKSLWDDAAIEVLEQAAVVHCHGFRQLDDLHKLRKKIGASYRLILSLHAFRNGTPWTIPFTNYVSGAVLDETTDTIHFLSVRSRAEFTHANVLLSQKLPYYVFPLGCNAEEFDNIREPEDIASWDYLPALRSPVPKVVYLATFNKGKQHRWLIDALAPVLLTCGAQLWLLGDGPELPAAKRHVEQRSLARHVVMPGRVPRRYVPFALSHMQVATCPSLSENSPHSIMEPLFAGVPIVTFDVGTASQLVSDFSRGFILGNPRSPAEFARKIQLILTDCQLQRQMACEAKQFARQFYTWRKCAQRTLAMYHAVMYSPESMTQRELPR